MFINRKLKITLDNQDYFFRCNVCKSSNDCMNGAKCKIVEYLSERLPDVCFIFDTDVPNVIVPSDDITRAQNVINRAIRKRCINRSM